MKQSCEIRHSGRTIIKKCYMCGTLMEDVVEQKKCTSCHKSFLPTNYFGKVHAKTEKEFNSLFSHCDELHEEDLIKGITVIW